MSGDPQAAFAAIKALVSAATLDELSSILEQQTAAILAPTAIGFLRERIGLSYRAGKPEYAHYLEAVLQLLLAVQRDGLVSAWHQLRSTVNPVTEHFKVQELRLHFLDVDSPEELLLLLRYKQHLLLTEETITFIRQFLIILQEHPDLAKQQFPEAREVERLLQLLEHARSQGIDDAWSQYCALLQQDDRKREAVFSRAAQGRAVEKFQKTLGRAVEKFRMTLNLQLGIQDRLLFDFAGTPPTDPRTLLEHAQRFTRPLDAPYVIHLLTLALEHLDREQDPHLWSEIRYLRGTTSDTNPLGDEVQNKEDAIADYEAVLAVEDRSFSKVSVLYQRATAYSSRSVGNKQKNLASAISSINEVLSYRSFEEDPYGWVQAIITRGAIYADRQAENPEESFEVAIADLDSALALLTPHPYAFQWARARANRGTAYALRIKGDPRENWQKALADFDAALTVYEENTSGWALAHQVRGAVLTLFDEASRLEEALTELHLALSYFTRETHPHFHTTLLLERGHVYWRLHRWAEAHQDYTAARKAQYEILDTATTEASLVEFIAGHARRDMYVRDVEAVLQLPNIPSSELVTILEEGRAQSLRAALDLDTLALARVPSSPEAEMSRAAVMTARNGWSAAQQALAASTANSSEQDRYRQELREAHSQFERARDAFRQFVPTFMAPPATIRDIADAITDPGEAIVYLAAGEQTGIALAVTRSSSGEPQVTTLTLPQFVEHQIDTLLWATSSSTNSTSSPQRMAVFPPLEDLLVGGYMLAQTNGGFRCLQRWGISINDAVTHLPSGSGLALAAEQLRTRWTSNPVLPSLLDIPFTDLGQRERRLLAGPFNTTLRSLELNRSLQMLGEWGLGKMAEWLGKQSIRKVALVSYGRLGLFPLPAVLVKTETQGAQPFSTLFEVTIIPNARSLKVAKQRRDVIDPGQRQILTVGNPLPLPANIPELHSAAAEAQTIRQIAQSFGRGPVCCLIKEEGTKRMVRSGLEQAWLAHLALHGVYDQQSPYQSRLILAGDNTIPEAERTITLEDCLKGQISLAGIRLLALSACETSIIDVRHASNEVVGLATGFLQAGAAGVIASLWAVADRPTYLLMSRFMQLYLDPQRQTWSPARCLADAQHWLREEATKEVLATYDPTTQVPLTSLPSFSRGATETLPRQEKELPYADPIYWAAFTVTGC